MTTIVISANDKNAITSNEGQTIIVYGEAVLTDWAPDPTAGSHRFATEELYPPPGISEPQLALAKRMEAAIRPKPMAELAMTSQSWVHVRGDHDSAIVVVRNGHVIGWLSAFELAQVMDGLKNACRWDDGVPLKFL